MDRTPEYHALLAAPEFDDAIARFEARLEGCTILFVPGFLADPMRSGYFLDQLRYFRSLSSRVNVDVAMPVINGEGSPEQNADALRAAVVNVSDGRRIVLFTHSKGSLDTLHMLMNGRDLWPRIESWVSVQGALLGSPVADGVSSNPYLMGIAAHILKEVFKGSDRALTCLRTDESLSFITANAAKIVDLLKEIKVLCYGSAISGWTPLAPFRDFMLERDLPNDGLMPIEHTFLPGADLIRNLAGPDHAAVVMAFGAPAFFDRARFGRILINLGL